MAATLAGGESVNPSTFKAFRITRTDRVESGLTQASLDQLSPGDVVIRTAYAGINYKDALATTEHGKVIRQFPRIGGSDASGWVVHSTHPAFKAGDPVVVYARGLGVDHDGGFAEYMRVPGDWLLPLPSGLTLLEAAALGIAGFTAALAVHLLQENGVRPEQGQVLVNGASGAVAGMAIEMLARLGYPVVAMSGKSHARERLLQLGAAEVVSADQFEDAGKPLASARWSAVVDSVGGQGLDWLLRTVKPRGVVASIGNAGGNEFSTNVLPFILRGVRLIGVNVTFYLDIETQIWQRLANDLKPAGLAENVGQISLEQLPHHIQRMLQAQTSGRTVVVFPQ